MKVCLLYDYILICKVIQLTYGSVCFVKLPEYCYLFLYSVCIQEHGLFMKIDSVEETDRPLDDKIRIIRTIIPPTRHIHIMKHYVSILHYTH